MAFRITRSNEELRDEESKTKCSERKLRANRDNAQKSTGPKSTRRTRHNAVRHGLLCDGISELDLSAGYSELLDELIAEKKPVGSIERHLIESIALYMIRIRRTRCLEAQFLNEWTYHPVPPLYERSVKPQRDLVQSLVCTFQRYESIFTARLIRPLRELETLQQQRNREPVPALNVQVDSGEDKALNLPSLMIREAREAYVGASHDNASDDPLGVNDVRGHRSKRKENAKWL
jgi:hypothetical protein